MTTTARITGPLTKRGLGEAVAAELGITPGEAHRVVEAVLNTIARTTAAGHPVAVTSFGTWRPVQRPARPARNPQSGEPVQVPARMQLRFRVSPQLKKAVMAGDPDAAVITKRHRAA
ncbi:HU family DNA-binding protein [Streptomyces sp. NPDC059928]|uniref:HU family DNA-binding protein n=1 Tax=unclassified Streptomyces TaxID=2593676 RepID=UPI00364CF0D8